MVEILDAHVHLWDTGKFRYEWLDHAIGLPQTVDVGSVDAVWGARPTGAVLIQADCDPSQGLAEARWLARHASKWQLTGVVAFAPVDDSAKLAGHLSALADIPAVVGVRRILQGLPAGALAPEAFSVGLGALGSDGLTFDACVRADQLSELANVLVTVPRTAVVIDHLGNPDVADGLNGAAGSMWLRDMGLLASMPNVHVKLSGALLHALQDPASSAAALPFLATAIRLFGSKRCMVGSDSPVSIPAAPYGRGWGRHFAQQLTLNDGEIRDILVRTATTFYQLNRLRS